MKKQIVLVAIISIIIQGLQSTEPTMGGALYRITSSQINLIENPIELANSASADATNEFLKSKQGYGSDNDKTSKLADPDAYFTKQMPNGHYNEVFLHRLKITENFFSRLALLMSLSYTGTVENGSPDGHSNKSLIDSTPDSVFGSGDKVQQVMITDPLFGTNKKVGMTDLCLAVVNMARYARGFIETGNSNLTLSTAVDPIDTWNGVLVLSEGFLKSHEENNDVWAPLTVTFASDDASNLKQEEIDKLTASQHATGAGDDFLFMHVTPSQVNPNYKNGFDISQRKNTEANARSMKFSLFPIPSDSNEPKLHTGPYTIKVESSSFNSSTSYDSDDRISPEISIKREDIAEETNPLFVHNAESEEIKVEDFFNLEKEGLRVPWAVVVYVAQDDATQKDSDTRAKIIGLVRLNILDSPLEYHAFKELKRIPSETISKAYGNLKGVTFTDATIFNAPKLIYDALKNEVAQPSTHDTITAFAKNPYDSDSQWKMKLLRNNYVSKHKWATGKFDGLLKESISGKVTYFDLFAGTKNIMSQMFISNNIISSKVKMQKDSDGQMIMSLFTITKGKDADGNDIHIYPNLKRHEGTFTIRERDENGRMRKSDPQPIIYVPPKQSSDGQWNYVPLVRTTSGN